MLYQLSYLAELYSPRHRAISQCSSSRPPFGRAAFEALSYLAELNHPSTNSNKKPPGYGGAVRL